MVDPQEVIALILKQMGGKVKVTKNTFLTLEQNYEILFSRSPMDDSLEIILVDDMESVSNIRANRKADDERKKALGRLIVP